MRFVCGLYLIGDGEILSASESVTENASASDKQHDAKVWKRWKCLQNYLIVVNSMPKYVKYEEE